MTSVNLQGASALSNVNLQGFDLETALMSVQMQRANLLDSQLATQIAAVKARNDKIGQYNNVLSMLTQAQSYYEAGKEGPKATDKAKIDTNWQKLEYQINTAVKEADIPTLGLPSDGKGRSAESTWVEGSNVYNGNTTRGQLEGAISSLKGQIDALNNSSQTDMLALQSLTNKRNEAFDVMTNFIKKMNDSRASIIGNMR